MGKARDIASGAPAPAGVTSTELGYVDGVTSAIQTQLNTKSAIADDFTAGKNKIINGDFGVWQRGTSFTGTGVYTADRWIISSDTTSPAVSRQTFTPGTAPVAGYEGQFFMRFTRGTGGSFCSVQQRIEDVRTFAGKTVTLSFWAKASATCTIEPFYIQSFGSGGSGDVAGSFGTVSTLTTSWVRYSYTVAIPSVSGKTIGTSSYLNILTARITSATNVDVDTWGVQVEAASTASPFQTATGTIQGELAACQRYYIRTTSTGTDSNHGMGLANSTTNAYIQANISEMRVIPTSIDYANLNVSDSVNNFTFSGLSINSANSTPRLAFLIATGASGMTQFRPMFMRNNASTSGYLGFSAEL